MIEQILGLGAQVGGSVIGHKNAKKNRDAQRKENELNRNFSREQYNTLRTHSLQDWNRQNEYNHPLQQMQRLREAGLNPNLVYGKGADNTAAMIRGSQANKVQTDAPTYDINAAMSPVITAANLSQIAAQTDNLYETNRLIAQDVQLKKAQTLNELQKGNLNKFEYELKKLIENDLINKQRLENAYTYEKTNTELLAQDQLYTQTQQNRAYTKLTESKTTEQDIKNSLLQRGLTPQSESYLLIMNAYQNANAKEKQVIGKLLGANLFGNTANLAKGILSPSLLKYLKGIK